MRYVIGVIAVVLITILAIILIITRSPSTSTTTKTGQKVLLASDFKDKDAKVTFTVQGRLVGDENRRAFRITVDRDSRKVEELDGYNQTAVRSQVYPNNQAGYEAFLKALDNYGFNRKRSSTYKDEVGVCPLGRTYVLSLSENGNDQLHTWATSCNSKQGTAAGPISTIQQLFQNQIPDYSKFAAGVSL